MLISRNLMSRNLISRYLLLAATALLLSGCANRPTPLATSLKSFQPSKANPNQMVYQEPGTERTVDVDEGDGELLLALGWTVAPPTTDDTLAASLADSLAEGAAPFQPVDADLAQCKALGGVR